MDWIAVTTGVVLVACGFGLGTLWMYKKVRDYQESLRLLLMDYTKVTARLRELTANPPTPTERHSKRGPNGRFTKTGS